MVCRRGLEFFLIKSIICLLLVILMPLWKKEEYFHREVLVKINRGGNHTAVLFPGHQYNGISDVIIVNNSPKNPKQRISLSYSRLNRSNRVFKIISGRSKCNVVRQWLQNIRLPINQINGDSEKVYLSQDALP